jgi:Domain of unknown function DUF29
MDNATLYDDDIVTWSEQQAAALRELASKPELSNAVDWGNVIEEIECLGRSEWKGVAGHLRNALAHVLKEVCDPDSFSRRAWAVETNNSLLEARDEFRDSMRQHIDIHAVWSRAFKQTAQSLEPTASPSLRVYPASAHSRSTTFSPRPSTTAGRWQGFMRCSDSDPKLDERITS